MQFSVGHTGERRRVHREYVDVYARFGRSGEIEPVVVMWRDGRSFTIDEIVEALPFGGSCRGRQTAVYRVRFGSHQTELYLERSDAVPSLAKPECLRWWVYAYDTTRSASREE